MASMTFSNAGIGNLFSGLAGALAGPSPTALIEADYRRTQRDNLASDTAINQQSLETMRRQEAAMSELATVLGDPTLATTPQGRADLMSVLSQVPDGLKLGPGFATGAASFTDPNFVQSDNDFSRILAGTGVQPDWSRTPTGYQQGLDNLIQQNTADNATVLAAAGIKAAPGAPKPGSLATVSPAVAIKFDEMTAAAIDAKFPGTAVDPATMQLVSQRATQIYQSTKNAPLAIEQAMSEAGLFADGQRDPGWGSALFPWDWAFEDKGTVTAAKTSLGDVLAPAAPAPAAPTAPTAPLPTPAPVGTGVPGAAPAAAPTAPAPAASPGMGPAVQANPDGTEFMLDPGGKPVRVVEGTEIVNSRGERMVRRGNTWQPI